MRPPFVHTAPLLRSSVAGAVALLLALGAAAARHEAHEAAGEPAPREAAARWEAELAPRSGATVSGQAALLRFAAPAPAEPAIWELRLQLAPEEGTQALSPHLRRGTCEEPGRIVVKAEPDLNVRGGRSTLRIPEHALPSAWIGPHPEGEPVPPTPATEPLVVEVRRRDGTPVACGPLQPVGDAAAH